MADRSLKIEKHLPPGVPSNIATSFPLATSSNSLKMRLKPGQLPNRGQDERAIQQIKGFRIPKHDLPISMAADVNRIWVICS